MYVIMYTNAEKCAYTNMHWIRDSDGMDEQCRYDIAHEDHLNIIVHLLK